MAKLLVTIRFASAPEIVPWSRMEAGDRIRLFQNRDEWEAVVSWAARCRAAWNAGNILTSRASVIILWRLHFPVRCSALYCPDQLPVIVIKFNGSFSFYPSFTSFSYSVLFRWSFIFSPNFLFYFHFHSVCPCCLSLSVRVFSVCRTASQPFSRGQTVIDSPSSRNVPRIPTPDPVWKFQCTSIIRII